MTRKQAERYYRLLESLGAHGFSTQDVDSLLRCSRQLSTWCMHECNGTIQRDEKTGKCYWYNELGFRFGRTSDRETGALNRAKSIVAEHGLTVYYQGDPRGCALWVIRPGDIPAGETVDSFYTNGVAVCID